MALALVKEEEAPKPAALTVHVKRASLRCGLLAALPHTASQLPALDRVRLQVIDDDTILVVASRSVTAVVARVRGAGIESADALDPIDLESRSVRELLAVFQPPKDKDAREQWNEETFEIRALADEVTVTESPGLVGEERSLTVPRLGLTTPAEYVGVDKIPSLLARAIGRDPAAYAAQALAWVDPARLAAVVATDKAFGSPDVTWMQFLADPQVLLVHIGQDALVLVADAVHDRPESDIDAEIRREREASLIGWSRDLAKVSSV